MEERVLDSKAVCKGERGMITDGNLVGSGKVQRIRRIPHARAKEDPELRLRRKVCAIFR